MIVCICRNYNETELALLSIEEFYEDVQCGKCEEEWLRLRGEPEDADRIT